MFYKLVNMNHTKIRLEGIQYSTFCLRTVVTSEMMVVVCSASSRLVASAQWTNICHFHIHTYIYALTYISMWLLQAIVTSGAAWYKTCTFKHLNNNLANIPSQCTQKTIFPSYHICHKHLPTRKSSSP